MKYYLIAGEASGDMHGANLIKSIKDIDSSAEFMFWGGDLMTTASNIEAKKHISELAIMGFWEVLKSLPTISKNIRQCKQEIADFIPDAVIFIDYPGFNLRIAPFVKSLGIKTFYYISPKIWAWKQKRVFKIKKYIDVLYSILPFEVEFYKKFNYPIKYVGNPILDSIENFKKTEHKQDEFESSKPLIAILPGSRKQEISRILPSMIETADIIDTHEFIIAGAPNFDYNFYKQFFRNKEYKIVFDNTYQLLSKAESAMVTSGTATLETALFGVPQVVCYKAGSISYHIAKLLVKIKYISLVNLILNKKAVTELIQDNHNTKKLSEEIKLIVKGGAERDKIIDSYNQLNNIMGEAGASTRVATDIYNTISKTGN